MSIDSTQEDYSRLMPEQLENTPYDLTRGQKVWFICMLAIALVSFMVGLWPLGIVALVALPFGWRTHEGIIYERLAGYRANRRLARPGPFFEPPNPDESVELGEVSEKGKRRAHKERSLPTPFLNKPLAVRVPYFGTVSRGVLYDPARNTDRFLVTASGWNVASLNLPERSASEADLSEALKETLSELDGGIGFKFLSGSRPRNIYPYAYDRYQATRKVVLDALEGESDDPVAFAEAEYLEELLLTEKETCVEPIMTIEFEVPRPAYWNKALNKRDYLTEGEIERSPLVQVMVAAYEGLNRVGIQGVKVMDMASLLSSVRSRLDIGGIDEFHQALHFAALRHSGEDVPWEDLFRDQRLWPRRIPKVGKDYVLTDQTIHRIFRMYRFRLRRVLPGFLDTLHLNRDNSWWFTFVYNGRTVSATSEDWWLTKQIVFREGARRVFRSGDRYETLAEQEYRELPRHRQDELYMSRGPAVKSNKYMIVSVPLPALSDDLDEDEQLEEGLHLLQLACNQYRSKARRLRIFSRAVKRRRQIEELSRNLA